MADLHDQLAQIEQNIKKQKKPSRQSKALIADQTVFSVNVAKVLERPDEPGPIPVTLERLMQKIEKDGLQTEGVFRIPGQLAEINKLKEEMDKNKAPNFSQYNMHVLCGALKMYVKELPDPIIPIDKFDEFIAATSMSLILL